MNCRQLVQILLLAAASDAWGWVGQSLPAPRGRLGRHGLHPVSKSQARRLQGGAICLRASGGKAWSRPGGSAGGDKGIEQIFEGKVKFFNQEKGFGFIEAAGGEVFVHARDLDPSVHKSDMAPGAAVEFKRKIDRNGKTAAWDVTVAGASASTMPCFSMSQPFASLLLNGIKTIETRNSDIFGPFAGQRVLLHVGRRPWKDDHYLERLRARGMTAKEIEQACALPAGFGPGDIVGAVTLGGTDLMTRQERMEVEEEVVATCDDMGKYGTPVKDAKWLKKPVKKVPGRPGVFQVPAPPELADEETVEVQ